MIKRVYQHVDTTAREGGFVVVLDGSKALRSPGGNTLTLPTDAMAAAIAKEWEGQGDEIDPESLRLTKLAGRAADLTSEDRARIESGLVAYIETDLICYRADHPADLVACQAAAWDPLIRWARQRFSEVPEVTTGVVPIVVESSVVACYSGIVAKFGTYELVAVQEAAAITGSLIIGLAVFEREVDNDAAWKACQVDDAHRIQRWGDDPEDASAQAMRRADLDAASHFLSLLHVRPTAS